MNTALSSQQSSAHLPASQSGLKPCQRSCRGLMLYFPLSPQPVSSTVQRNQATSWRSSEPVCVGLSAARNGPNLDLQKLHEAREIPAGQNVDFSVVIGHAVYQTTTDIKVLPPGCMTGLEFMRFCKMQTVSGAAGEGQSTSEVTASSGSAPIASTPSAPALAAPVVSAIKVVTSSLKSFASGFRILTSSADTNARLSKTWSSIVDFDPQQYVDKFESQAYKNIETMQKWLRDLQAAVSSKPKA